MKDIATFLHAMSHDLTPAGQIIASAYIVLAALAFGSWPWIMYSVVRTYLLVKSLLAQVQQASPAIYETMRAKSWKDSRTPTGELGVPIGISRRHFLQFLSGIELDEVSSIRGKKEELRTWHSRMLTVLNLLRPIETALFVIGVGGMLLVCFHVIHFTKADGW